MKAKTIGTICVNRILLIGSASLALALLSRSVAAETMTLDFIRASHTASRQAIDSCTCQVDFALRRLGKSPTTVTKSAQYLRSGYVFRIRQSSNEGVEDIVYENGMTRSASEARDSSGKVGRGGAVLPAEEYPNISCDPWAIGLLLVPIPNTISFAPFEQFLANGAKVRKVEARQEGGRSLVAIELSYDQGAAPNRSDWDVVIWFDPKVNYLIRKIVLVCNRTANRQSVRREYEVLEFAEPAPSVFFPMKTASSISVDGQIAQTTEAVLSKIRVKMPVPAGAFRLEYVPGTTMEDRVNGTRYQVAKDGSPISRPESFVATPLSPGLPERTGRPQRTETKEEARFPTVWLFSASLGVLALAGLLSYLRRRAPSAT